MLGADHKAITFCNAGLHNNRFGGRFIHCSQFISRIRIRCLPDVWAGHRSVRFSHLLCSKAIDFARIRADIELTIGDGQSPRFAIDFCFPCDIAIVSAEGIHLVLPTGKHKVVSNYQFRITLTWHAPSDCRSDFLTAMPA